jgi:acyl homoserine lactone synthase
MIVTINGNSRHLHVDLINQMHILRKEVFFDRLKWDVEVNGNWEIDHFDDCDPLYILSLDDNGNVRGSLRLLPTTGPNMLRDVFFDLLPPDTVIEAPTIWESSRFSVSLQDSRGRRSLSNLNFVTAELIAAMGEIGLIAGLSNIVTVYDRFLRRIIARAGCVESLVGGPLDIGGVMTYAGLFRIDEQELAAFKKDWGIEGALVGERLFNIDTAAA